MKQFCMVWLLAVSVVAAAAQAPSSAGLPFTPKGQRGAYNTPGASTREGIGETSPYRSAREQYEALKRAAHGGRRLTAAQLPDWSGTWTAEGAFATFDPSLARDATHYGPLAPGNQAFYEQVLANAENNIEWDPLSYCLPAGAVRWSNIPRLRDFAVTPGVVYLLNELQSEVRRIYTDGRDHRPEDEAYPLWNGDSIGFWDGRGDHARLIAWTNHLRAGVYHRNGPRYSEQTELVEVFQKDRPDHIRFELTVYDPVDLTRPWKIERGFIKGDRKDERIDTWSCDENNFNLYYENGVTKFRLPGEPEYRDPEVLTDPTRMLETMSPRK